jgi:hypothetical protein
MRVFLDTNVIISAVTTRGLCADLLPPFAKGRNYPSLEKRGEGRFSEEYVFSIMDSLVSSNLTLLFILDPPFRRDLQG